MNSSPAMSPFAPPVRAVVALVLLAGCVPSTDDIERRIERELPELLGPADRYEVEIEGLRARDGRADRVVATGERVRMEEAPILDRLRVEMEGVAYDRGAERLERVDSLAATAYVRPADLAAFLEAHRNVREAAVTFHPPDEAAIRLRPELVGLALPRGMEVVFSGRLEARDGQLHFDVIRAGAAGAGLGEAVVRRLSDALNPLVDLSSPGADLRIIGVRVEGDGLRLDAAGSASGLRLRRGS